MPLSNSMRAQIQGLIEQHKVVLFMKGNKHFPQCGFSAKCVQMLKEAGTPFEAVNVLSNPELRDGIKDFSDWPTIPQLYVDKEFIGGCDIVTEMFQTGELQKKLGVEVEEMPPPAITLTAAAAAAFKEAQEPGAVLHVEISTDYQYELFFDAPKSASLITKSEGMDIHVSRGSAKRANGMHIDFVKTDGGGAFKIENPNEPPKVKSISVEDLKAMLDKGETFELLDVRSADERNIAKLEKSQIFDADTQAKVQNLPKSTKIVLHCHHGGRSRAAAEKLVSQGYKDVSNVDGGIDAWSIRIDKSLPRY